ncbi:MAG: methionyl-tRNA formyltransferase [Candidatus Binataceae bacterium]
MVFMGTPALAAHILDRLVAAGDPRFRVTAVVTRPDEPRGRGLALAPSEVGAVAQRHGIPTLKPDRIRTPEFLAELKSLELDLLVIAAYGRILPQAILDATRLMPLNVHASLLPRHRGAAPIEGAILAGDAETGVTIMRVTAEMDAGPMILKRAIPIAPDDTQGSMKEKLAELGAVALLEALDQIARGIHTETRQDESAVTYTKQIKKEDATIDWNRDAATIERMTRAYDPWPVARTTAGGQPLMIWRARVDAAGLDHEASGSVVAVKPAPVVQCGGGRLVLVEVQAPGRKRMSATDFFNGRRIGAGARLGT